MTEQAQADHEFKTELTALIPQMRAFARSLCRDATAADDLAQDALRLGLSDVWTEMKTQGGREL